ncbi:MAG: YfhO family protein [Candidatus Saccharimonadales bacterium]
MKPGKNTLPILNNFIKKFTNFVAKNKLTQAALVGLIITLPFMIYVSVTHSIIAPLNILSGWDTSNTTGSVIAKIPSDVNQQMLPFRQYIKDSLVKHAEIPLWNTKSFGGDVFLANPINTVLSPFNVLLFFVSIYTYQNIIVIIGIFLMASCTYLLLRQLKTSAGAGFLGAVAYSLAPFSIFWSLYGVIAIPMASIPFVLYLYYRWRESRKTLDHNLVLLSLTLGLVIFMGHIQIALLPYIVLAVAVLFDILFNKLRGKNILFISGAAILALMIGFAQLGPLITQTPASHRSATITAEPPANWSDRLSEIAKIPQAYPLASGPTTIGTTTRRDLHVGQIPGIFFIIAMIIAVTTLIKARKPTVIHLFIFLFILGAFWKWNDFPQTILNILSPTLKSLASDYFLPIGLLAMAVLAAFGLDFVIKFIFRKGKLQSKNKYPAFVLVIPLLATIALSLAQINLSIVDNLSKNYYHAYYFIICATLIFYVLLRRVKFARLFFVLTIVAVSLVQGWALYRVSQPIVSDSILHAGNAQLAYISSQSNKDPTIVDYIGPQESGLYGVSLLSGYDSLYSTSLLPRTQAINYPNSTPHVYRDNALIINTVDKPTLFKNLGVEYTINKAPKDGYREVSPNVYKADVPTPSVYFASSINNESTDAQLETIKSGSVGYHEVLIEGNHSIADTSSSLTYTRTANSLTITTQSSTGGLVFIAQTFNKDWSVQIDDGSTLTLQSAYYDFSALDIPSGHHVITLNYRPAIATIGFILSGVTVLITIILLLYTLNLRRKDRGKKEL